MKPDKNRRKRNPIRYKRWTRGFLLFLSIFLMLHNYRYVNAETETYTIEGEKESYQYQELLSRYTLNSPAYKRNTLTFEIDSLEGIVAGETYDTYNSQVTSISETIAVLNSKIDSLKAYKKQLEAEEGTDNTALLEEIDSQLATLESQLSQYTGSLSTANENTADAKLQKDISAFYKNYQQALILEGQRKLKNEFLKNCYQLIIYREQIGYYEAYKDYLAALYQVETIKYNNGYSTKDKLDAASVNLDKNDTAILKYQNLYDSSKSQILSQAGISNDITMYLDIPLTEKTYDTDKTASQFIADNTDYMKLYTLKESYQNYLDSNGVSSSADRDRISLQIQDYQIQTGELHADIIHFVTGALQTCHSAFKEKEAARKALVLKENNYKITEKKLSAKRATKLELQQALMEIGSAKVTYYQSCYEIKVWENIIENSIYGAEP